MSNNQNEKPIQPLSGPKGKTMPSYKRGPLGWLIIAVVIFTAMMMLQQWQKVDAISWNDFRRYLENNQIESVEIGETEITGRFNQKAVAERGEKLPPSFTVDYKPEVVGEELIRILSERSTEAVQAAIQIVASSQQQVIGMDQIGVAMQNINQAGTETAVSMVQSEKAAKNLHELGQKLKDLVERFKV